MGGVVEGCWAEVLELWERGNLATTELTVTKQADLHTEPQPSPQFVLLLLPAGTAGLLAHML